MNSDEAIERAAQALAAGTPGLAADHYETAAHLLLTAGREDAAAVHFVLAAQYCDGEHDRADALLLRAQTLYSARGHAGKHLEVLLVRASRAATGGHHGKAERLFTECVLHAAARLAAIAGRCLEMQGPLSADPEADVLLDHIAHIRGRIKELRQPHVDGSEHHHQ